MREEEMTRKGVLTGREVRREVRSDTAGGQQNHTINWGHPVQVG